MSPHLTNWSVHSYPN